MNNAKNTFLGLALALASSQATASQGFFVGGNVGLMYAT